VSDEGIVPTTAARVPGDADLVVRAARSDTLADDLLAAGVSERVAEVSGFSGKADQTLFVASTDGPDCLVVGVGLGAEADRNRFRSAAGTAGRQVTRHARVAVALAEVADGRSPVLAQAVAEGWVLGAYSFCAHRSDPANGKVEAVTVTAGSSQRAKDAVARGVAIARAVNRTRDLVNEPGAVLTPSELASRIKAIGSAAGLAVKVDGPARIAQRDLGGVLGVARGSANEPRFVEMSYEPSGRATGHVALVGKGVTFDTGGYSLKTSEGMKGMNGDMAGAAAIACAMSLLPKLKARARVTAYLPLVENMIGPDAIRVGDVLTARGGTTIEVLNTDAEGRLILADGLRLASEAEPDAIIDVATLTGACMVALGPRVAGLFGNNANLVDRIRAVADEAGESVWPMPMPEHLRPGLDSDVADIRNVAAGRYGGASVAALFLRHFVGDRIPWAHLDIAGPAWVTDSAHGEIPKQGTGFGVRLLANLLANWSRLPK
jgi:leucyl aminopeptidase